MASNRLSANERYKVLRSLAKATYIPDNARPDQTVVVTCKDTVGGPRHHTFLMSPATFSTMPDGNSESKVVSGWLLSLNVTPASDQSGAQWVGCGRFIAGDASASIEQMREELNRQAGIWCEEIATRGTSLEDVVKEGGRCELVLIEKREDGAGTSDYWTEI